MTLEDLRIRLNQHRMILGTKNRISDEHVRLYYEDADGNFHPLKSTELFYEDNKAIIILK